MKLETQILEKLKADHSVALEGFGTFYLKNSEAKILEKTTRILPPAKEIALEFDYQQADKGFAQELAEKNMQSLPEVQKEVSTHTLYWKNQLSEAKELKLEGLGTFYSDGGEVLFKGQRLEISSPDNFGLEEIDLKKLKEKKSSDRDSPTAYKTQKSYGWLLLLLIPAAGLVVLALTNREFLFGKNSVLETPPQISKPSPKKDTIQTETPKANRPTLESTLSTNKSGINP
ncbi:hypothetical protein ACX3PU_00135 [Chryseobacterium sp. A301]